MNSAQISGAAFRSAVLLVLLAAMNAQRILGATFEQGDANEDGRVDLIDFVEWRGAVTGGNFPPPQSFPDFNFDGSVDIADFLILNNNLSVDADDASFVWPPGELQLVWNGVDLSIENTSGSVVAMTGYHIFSPENQFDALEWNTIGAQAPGDFTEANPSSTFLAELSAMDAKVFDQGEVVSLGAPFSGDGELLASWVNEAGDIRSLPYTVVSPPLTEVQWGVQNGGWLNRFNWNPAIVPGMTETATIANGGTAVIPSASDIAVGGLTLSNGVIENHGNLNVLGSSDWRGGTMGGSGVTNFFGATLIDGSAPKTITGSVVNAGKMFLSAGAVDFAGLPGGTSPRLLNMGRIEVVGNGTLLSTSIPGAARLVNEATGVIHRSNNLNAAVIAVPTINQGLVEVLDGALEFEFGLTNTQTGTIAGTGVLAGNVTSNGLVAPGFSPGVLQIEGDFVQEPNGVLEIEVGGLQAGEEHDQLIVSGSAQLNGRLEVPLIDGFVPSPGDEIVFLLAGSVEGTFGALAAPNLGTANPGVAIEVLYGSTDARLRFVEPGQTLLASSRLASRFWSSDQNWVNGIVPSSTSVVEVQNEPGMDQQLNVAQGNAFAHQLSVSGNDGTMTVGVRNGNVLSVTSTVLVGSQGRIELGGAIGPGILVSGAVEIQGGGELAGEGTVVGDVSLGRGFAGAGLATLRPGLGIGRLNIEGNYQQGSNGRMVVEVGQIDQDEAAVDLLSVSGQASLAGTLELDATNFAGPLGPAGRFVFLRAGSLGNVGPDTSFAEVEVITQADIYFALVPGGGTVGRESSPAVGSVIDFDVLSAQGCPLGDMNCDDGVDMDDLPLLALALVDAQQYRSTVFAETGYLMFADDAGDVNNRGDGLDFDDIDAFLAKLSHNGFGATRQTMLAAIAAIRLPVPEPSSFLAVLVLGGFITSFWTLR